MSSMLVENLERTRPALVRMLSSTFETGLLLLPGGRRGLLRRSLIFLTSSLGSREILEAGRGSIGFTPAGDEPKSERARVFESCYAAAVRQ